MDLERLGCWRLLLDGEWEKPYFRELMNKVDVAYGAGIPAVYPPQEDVFRAFELTAPENVKLVILGQVILSPWSVGSISFRRYSNYIGAGCYGQQNADTPKWFAGGCKWEPFFLLMQYSIKIGSMGHR